MPSRSACAAGAEIDLLDVEKYCFVGELALTGLVRPVKGVLPIALEARKQGRRAVIVPEANAREAAMVDGIEVYAVRNRGDRPRLRGRLETSNLHG